jgi:hypothetical protein
MSKGSKRRTCFVSREEVEKNWPKPRTLTALHVFGIPEVCKKRLRGTRTLHCMKLKGHRGKCSRVIRTIVKWKVE